MTIDVANLKKYMREYSDAQLEKEAQNELQKSIVETAAEKLDMDKAQFKQHADLFYKKEYKPEAFEKAEALGEVVETIKTL